MILVQIGKNFNKNEVHIKIYDIMFNKCRGGETVMAVKRAVVFSGGGAKGGYQIGAWKALIELNFRPNIVTGTSVGALNGALMALDKFDDALYIWENMGMDSVFSQFVEKSNEENPKKDSYYLRLVKEILTKGGADYTPLKECVKGLMDEKKLRESDIKFGLVTTAFPKIKPVELFIDDIPEGSAADYILASAAAFPLLKSYRINDVKYVDGGYSDNMPIKMALEKGAQEVVAVNVGKMNVSKLGNTDAVIHYIQNKRPYNDGKIGSIIYFNKELSLNNIRQGYLDTLKSFGKYDGFYYTFEKYERYKVTPFEKHCALKFEYIFPALPGMSKVEKFGRDNVLNLLRGYDDRPFEFNSNVLYCAEIAAEVLCINPREIYTMKTISMAILQETKKLLNDTSTAQKLEYLIKNLDKGVSLDLLKSLIDVKDKRLMTFYGIKLLRNDSLTFFEKKRLWIIACLSAESFCSALFCSAVLAAEENNELLYFME